MLIQIVIIICYFALTLTVGILTSKETNSRSYSGEQLGVVAIVCASAGEWLGGTATTGVSEYGFVYGISGAWYTIANGLGVLFLALFFAKIYRSIGRLTIPGIIQHLFGNKAQLVSSILLVIVMLAVGMSQIIAAGKFGQALLGLDFNISAVVFTLIFVIYTLAGGMKAVSSTNKLHLFVMYFGILAAVIILVNRLGGLASFRASINAIDSQEGTNHLSMISIGFPKVSSWVIASLLGACTAQAGIQPVLAARDVPTARKSCFYTALVTAPFGLMTALIGMVGKVMSAQGSLLHAGKVVTDGKLALTSVMMTLPPLIGGLVLAAEMAAILSTVSPIILAAGTMLTKDIYQSTINPKATEQQKLTVSRITTAVSGIICCLGAIALVNNNNVLDIVYSAYSLRGALFIIIVFGLFWKKRSNTKAACVSMICTGIVAVSWVVIKQTTGAYPIASWFTETYAAVITASVTMWLGSFFLNRYSDLQSRLPS